MLENKGHTHTHTAPIFSRLDAFALTAVGVNVGWWVGKAEGKPVGLGVGVSVGAAVGADDGTDSCHWITKRLSPYALSNVSVVPSVRGTLIGC